jgi:hypothetical protein
MNATRANVVNKTDGLQPVGYRAFQPGQVKFYPVPRYVAIRYMRNVPGGCDSVSPDFKSEFDGTFERFIQSIRNAN